jgi:hypothetical protein
MLFYSCLHHGPARIPAEPATDGGLKTRMAALYIRITRMAVTRMAVTGVAGRTCARACTRRER